MLTRPVARVELVPPAALVAGRPSSHYFRSSLTSVVPIVASLSICFAIGYIGVLGALLAAFALVGICFAAATRSRFVQRCLDRQTANRARARRDSSRQRALGRAGAARQQQYSELRDLVDGIECSDPLEAQRFELQELLDYFVQLSVGHQRCLESLRISGVVEPSATTPISEKPRAKDRHGIMARRSRHREQCTARIERIADEIESADELIRLVAQRVVCANLDPLIDREIDRRLAELDEVDAALSQLFVSSRE